MMAYWLLKSEPESYGWADLVTEGSTEWTGVRNHAAVAHLRMMRVGDEALFYHSGAVKAAVGLCAISRAARKDGAEGNWVSVEIEPVKPLTTPVTLAAMKAEAALGKMAMIRQSRLSVSPVTDAEWQVIMALAGQ